MSGFGRGQRLSKVDLPPTGSAFGQGRLVVARECGNADTPQRAQPARCGRTRRVPVAVVGRHAKSFLAEAAMLDAVNSATRLQGRRDSGSRGGAAARGSRGRALMEILRAAIPSQDDVVCAPGDCSASWPHCHTPRTLRSGVTVPRRRAATGRCSGRSLPSAGTGERGRNRRVSGLQRRKESFERGIGVGGSLLLHPVSDARQDR